MSVFFKMAGRVSPETSAVEYLKAFQRSYREIPKQVSSQMRLMPPEAASMPAVQFRVADAQLVPAQLPKVQNQIFVMAEQNGMFGAYGMNAPVDDIEAMDRSLDNTYTMPLIVNGRLMMVGIPRSVENLDRLAGVGAALSHRGENVQPRASSVRIEEISDDEEEESPAAPPAQPAPAGFCSGLIYILCTPFRWLGALFSAIGRCFGCSSY